MSNFSITLPKTYEVPSIIAKLSTDEWIILFNYISELLMKHDSLNSKLSEDTLKEHITKQYESKFNAQTEELTKYKQEIEALTTTHKKQMDTLKHTADIEYKEKIDKIVNDEVAKYVNKEHELQSTIAKLEHQIASTQSKFDDRLTSIEAKYEARIAEKDKRLDELREQTHEKITTSTDKLAAQYEEKLAKALAANFALTEQFKALHIDYTTKYETKVNNLRQQLTDENNVKNSKYEEQLTTLKKQLLEEKKSVVDNYEEQIETLTTTIKALTEQIKSLSTELTTMQSDIQSQAEAKYTAQIDDLKKQNSDISKLTSELNKSIDSIQPLKKFILGSNEEKGTLGENSILNLLKISYLSGVVEDVSKTAASGDLLFKYKQLKCLIEVKNKNKITIDDVDKFKRDIQTNKSTINCGIFVTIMSASIPGYSQELIQLDYVEGVPTIYTYLQSPHDLLYSVACLEKILTTNDTKESKMFVEHFKQYYLSLVSFEKYFNKQLIIRKQEVRTIEKYINSIHTKIKSLTDTYVSIEPTSNESESEDEEEHLEEPSLIKLNADPYQQLLNFYVKSEEKCDLSLLQKHFDNVDEVIKNKFTSFEALEKKITLDVYNAYITPAIVNKIIAYNNEHGKPPTREIIISSNIMPDNDIRKLTRSLKLKNPTESIIKYCLGSAPKKALIAKRKVGVKPQE